MKKEEIGFGTKGEDGKIVPLGKATMDMPENLEEAANMYGEDVVLSACVQSIRISAQAVCRRAAQAENATEATVQTALDNYKPGVVTRSASGGPSMATLRKKLKGVSKEQLAGVLADLGISLEDDDEGEDAPDAAA